MIPSPTEQARWFSEEVLPHNAQLKAYLRGSFPHVRDVDDVVQESYARLWKARAVQSVRSAKGFLFRIARCVATDTVRRERGSPVRAIADLAALCVAAEDSCGAEAACVREELALLADAIESLPPRCRQIMILRKLQRVPQKQIALRLGISEQTVQVQVLKGVKRCGEYLNARGVASAHPYGA